MAVDRSRPPVRMPGYWRCWRTWLIVARSLGLTWPQCDELLPVYQAATLRACDPSSESLKVDTRADQTSINLPLKTPTI